jgi:hypothetical protein
VSAIAQLEVLETEVDERLTSLIEAAKRQLADLERDRTQLDRRIDTTLRQLRAGQTALRALGRGSASPSVALVPHTKRDAVLLFLAEHPFEELRLVEIRRALIERGWMTAAHVHALEVAITGMAARGEVARVRKGVYSLQAHGAHSQE